MSADGALEQLVHQFSDPLSFFRELIQNALDAGSPGVDVWFEYEPAKRGEQGIMIIHVDDYGEGMDREIIDTRLTRLFSSAKDGDFTKIGRFGIGFVSVFAVQPEAVCVDTSRGGEHWRVLFEEDRSFTRIAREEPVDGTQIRIYKSIDEAGYEDFVRRAGETVRFWCKHVEEAEIRFEDELINEPVDLSLPVVVRHEAPGTRIVAGYSEDGSASYGFYNKGLTLLEGSDEEFFPGVRFKISSRYLEHTLTRDNVLRDAHFRQAMALLKAQIEEALPLALFEKLSEAAQRGERKRRGALKAMYRVAARIIEGGHVPKSALSVPIIPRAGDKGGVVSVAACLKARSRGHLYRTPDKGNLGRGCPVIRMLEAEEDAVVVVDVPGAAGCLELDEPLPTVHARWCVATPLEGEPPPGWSALRAAVEALIDEYGGKVSEIALGRFDHAGSSISDRVAISQRTLWALTPLDEARALGTSFFSRRRALVINGRHRAVAPLLALAEAQPALAAYFLVKLFFLGATLAPEVDARLAEITAARL